MAVAVEHVLQQNQYFQMGESFLNFCDIISTTIFVTILFCFCFINFVFFAIFSILMVKIKFCQLVSYLFWMFSFSLCTLIFFNFLFYEISLAKTMKNEESAHVSLFLSKRDSLIVVFNVLLFPCFLSFFFLFFFSLSVCFL